MQQIFSDFIEKLAINDIDLRQQITKWKECLENNFSIDFVRKSGSTRRGTDLSYSDVDLIVLYNKGRTYTSVLEPFFAIAEQDISRCFGKISKMDHGFVYIEISNVNVDIVIGFTDDTNPLVFWIPDKQNDEFVWIETSPDASEKRIKDANRLTSGKAGKYVRLMKYWNIKNNKPFNSFHLETLVVKNILTDSEKFNKISYAEGVHYLFRYLIDAIEKKDPQPSRRAPNLGDILEDQRKMIIQLLSHDMTMSGDALDFVKISDQIGAWKCIFGDELTS